MTSDSIVLMLQILIDELELKYAVADNAPDWTSQEEKEVYLDLLTGYGLDLEKIRDSLKGEGSDSHWNL